MIPIRKCRRLSHRSFKKMTISSSTSTAITRYQHYQKVKCNNMLLVKPLQSSTISLSSSSSNLIASSSSFTTITTTRNDNNDSHNQKHRSRNNTTNQLKQNVNSGGIQQQQQNRHLSLSNSNDVGNEVVPSSTTTSGQQEMEQQQQQGSSGLFRLLSDKEKEILNDQRILFNQARSISELIIGIQKRDEILGGISSGYLDELGTFSLVVIGEFNSGKTTFINALLGDKLLETGSLPTTDSITIISSSLPSSTTLLSSTLSSFDEQQEQLSNEDENKNNNNSQITTKRYVSSMKSVGAGLIHYTVNHLPLLNDLTIVDTPGTNAVLTDHTLTTLKLLPSADLILFITSVDRPFPESERILLNEIASLYRKSVIIIINKMDILDQAGGIYGDIEKQKVIQFVTDHASTILGSRPIIIPLSSRDALTAKMTYGSDVSNKNNTGISSIWERSNFHQVEQFLIDTLTTQTKIKSKLLNPIGIIESLMNESMIQLHKQNYELNDDIATLNLLNIQFIGWNKELLSCMDIARNDILSFIHQNSNRPYILLRRYNSLKFLYMNIFDTNQFENEWDKTKSIYYTSSSSSSTEQSTISSNTCSNNDNILNEKEILYRIIRDVSDTIATRGRAQGQAVIEFLGKRPSTHANQSLVGNVLAASRFEDTRQNLVLYMSSIINKHIPDNNTIILEERILLKRLQQSALLTTLLSTGTITTVAFTIMQSIDIVSGLVSTTILGLSSLYGLSYNPKRIAQNYYNIWNIRKHDIEVDMILIGTKEMDRIHQKIKDGIIPYSRYIEAQQENINNNQEKCHVIVDSAKQLRKRINSL